MTDWIPEPYRTAGCLEQDFGDPADEQSVFSFKRSLEYDEREGFPEQILGFVHKSDFNSYLFVIASPIRSGSLTCACKDNSSAA